VRQCHFSTPSVLVIRLRRCGPFSGLDFPVTGVEKVELLRGEEDVSPTFNPQPGRPGYFSISGISASRSISIQHGWPYHQLTAPTQLSEFNGACQLLHQAIYSFVGVEIPSRKPIFVYLLTYSTEQSSSSEANSFSVSQKNYPHFMKPEGSLPHSQMSATCPYPEPHRSSTRPHPTSWRFILILSSHLGQGLPSGLFPSGFPTKTLYTALPSSIRATCPAHLILLGLITRTILREYRSSSSSLCSCLHSCYLVPLRLKYSP
jgi:hypothetical protein